MGKKVIMNNSQYQKKKKKKYDFNKLIKLLKPKVYITESCNFKNLVQQLTGNNNGSIISSPSQDQVSQELDFCEEYKRTESWLLLESDNYYNYCRVSSTTISVSI